MTTEDTQIPSDDVLTDSPNATDGDDNTQSDGAAHDSGNDFQWDVKPDPLDELRSEIATLRSEIGGGMMNDDDFKTEVAKEVMRSLSPLLEETLVRPKAIESFVNDVCKGLGPEAKQYISDYITDSGYTSQALAQIRKADPRTVMVLRKSAESVDAASKKQAKSPVKSEASLHDDGYLDTTVIQQINIQAPAIAAALGISVADAKAELERQYKEQANAQ